MDRISWASIYRQCENSNDIDHQRFIDHQVFGNVMMDRWNSGPYFPTPFFFFRVLMVDDCSPAFDVLDGAGCGDAGNFG